MASLRALHFLDEDSSTSAVQIQRQDWEATAMKRLPDILAFKEKARPFLGVPSYSTHAVVSRTEDKTKLSAQLMVHKLHQRKNIKYKIVIFPCL